jgi:O-succinylbenzoic acid--CoA ligase
MNFLKTSSVIQENINPNNPAIITNKYTITYSDLQKLVVETASSLIELEITMGDYVSIISDNNEDFVILVLALWLIDAIPVPINTRLYVSEIDELIAISGSKKILVHKSLESKFKSNRKIIFPFPKSRKNNFLINSLNDENKTAAVIFTSGSTGIPKGVMLSFRNLIRSVEIGDKILNQSSDDRWLVSLPFYHIGGFSIITRTLLAGASMIIPDSSDFKDFIKSIKKLKPTLASFVGTQLKKLLDEKISPYNGIKNILIGGGFVDDSLINTALNKGWKISKVYGSSEVSSFVAAITSDELMGRIKSSGKAIPPNEVVIVSEKREILPPNSVGEIAVKSDSVFKGYLNNEIETKKKLTAETYYTGDIGSLDNEGYLFVQARRSDLIVTGGENVNPMEVEKYILQSEKIKDCCVIGIEDKIWGQIVAAAIVSKDRTISEESVKNFLRKKLAGFKIPKRILFVDYLPRTSLGKVEKEKIKALMQN